MQTTLAQDLIESLKTGILGMGIVMGTLYILSLILDLMKLIFYPQAKQQKKNELETTKQQTPQHDTQLIAIITAAISQHIQKPTTQIKINSIKQIHKTTPIWAMAARIQNKVCANCHVSPIRISR